VLWLVVKLLVVLTLLTDGLMLLLFQPTLVGFRLLPLHFPPFAATPVSNKGSNFGTADISCSLNSLYFRRAASHMVRIVSAY